MRVIKTIFGVILVILGAILTIGGIADPDGHIVIPFGIIFLIPGVILLIKKKKKPAETLDDSKKAREKTINQSAIYNNFPDNISNSPQKSEKIVLDRKTAEPQITIQKEQKMAKCVRCGKGGFFHKVNREGLCTDCERIRALEIEEKELRSGIEGFKSAYENQEKLYNDMKGNREKLYNEIAGKAKEDALKEIDFEINKKNQELEGIKKSIEDQRKTQNDVLEELTKSQKSISLNANKLLKVQSLFKSIQYSVRKYFDDETQDYKVDDAAINEADDLLSTTVKIKLNLMDIRELRKRYTLNSKIIKELMATYEQRYTTKANATIYKLMVIALEAGLQNILYNLKYSKLDKAVKDIKMMTAKYQKIAAEGNQSIASTVTKFIGEVEYLFIEAIKIEYEYYIQKERIKEEQKAIREKMRQEAKERKQLEQERKKIEQEEEKYKNEITTVQAQLAETSDAGLKKQLEDRLVKIQSQLTDVENKKVDIIKLEHGQAGYIYVISNLGSFGENIFKIGMTRRLDPQERIDELGDASVPFRFDVHCTIFSNNASELETQLHKQLHNNRVNKINLRKEFFKTTIDELEELVYSLEPSASFNRTMLAEQYHQSLAVNEVPESVEIIDEEDGEDGDENELD